MLVNSYLNIVIDLKNLFLCMILCVHIANMWMHGFIDRLVY